MNRTWDDPSTAAERPSVGTRLHPSGRVIPDGLNEALVRAVVDHFHAQVRRDDIIGPVFNRIIAEAVWPHHLDLITDFWSSMPLGSGRYAGRPIPKYLAIGDLEDAHFVRWLALFRDTVEALCPPAVAALFVDRAERVAHSFRIGPAMHRGQDCVTVAPMRAGTL